MSNRFLEIQARAKQLNAKTRAIQNSPAYERVVGVLAGLGFLIAPDVKQLRSSKIDFKDALRIGVTVEPRIIEVLPAAVLSFPRSFLHLEKAPEQFKEIVRALECGKIGPSFEGIEFQKFFEAANRPTRSRKRKIVSERRLKQTFRLSRTTIQRIHSRARERGITYTRYLESLVNEDGTNG